jgi:hypothetical protein
MLVRRPDWELPELLWQLVPAYLLVLMMAA